MTNENRGDSPENAPSASSGTGLPSRVLRRNRAVAEREASRLARPDRPVGASSLGHASRKKSAVASVPMGLFVKSSTRTPRSGRVSEGTAAEDDWCGPFSVARQMIEAREDARRVREADQRGRDHEGGGTKVGLGEFHPLDEIINEVDMERKRKAHPSMSWRGSGSGGDARENYYSKRRRQLARQREASGNSGRIPSLFGMCVDLIVNNFESVEALGDVGVDVRRSICESLVAKGKMNGAAFDVLAGEEGIEVLDVVDCSEVTQDQLIEALDKLVPAGLRGLMLNHAGRCFGSLAVQSIVSSPANVIFAINIGGAYLLKDDDASKLVGATAPTVSSLGFQACPLLGSSFCNSVSHHFSSSGGNGSLLELTLEDLPLTKKDLIGLASSSDSLRDLKSVSLRRIDGVEDNVIVSLLSAATGGNLEHVDLSHNVHLTDECLPAIRRCNKNGKLRSLRLSGLKDLTSAGLEAFFTFAIPELPSPPTLRRLDLSSCHVDAINDRVLKLAAVASSSKQADQSSLSQLGGLVYVNVGGSSVTDESMEALAARASRSLEELDISFCPHISDKGLGYLVSKAERQLAKLHVWGNAQLTDDFLDGHARVEEGGMDIVGVWMKQSGRRSMR
jgi:hypothetical protein